ncbi:MAG: Fe-S cluster assembly sulfur transfer protein SufU [Nanoarchaeota archaeon]
MTEKTENLDPKWLGNNTEEDEMYKENILDHFKNPRNFGRLKEYTLHNKEHNPVCGDQIELFIKLEEDKIKDIKFIGNGCAISMASISMLTDRIKNMSIEDVKNINKEEILNMIGIKLGPVRLKCSLLSLKTLLNSIAKMEIENEQIRN